jgi:hypothetical protein
MRDNMHDAGHCDGAVKQQTLPAALEWLWQGYSSTGTATER